MSSAPAKMRAVFWTAVGSLNVNKGHSRGKKKHLVRICVNLLANGSALAALQANMSQNFPTSSSSSSNFQSIFNAALEAYENKTKKKLLTHPLATQLQSCHSPTAVLSVLQDLIQKFNKRRGSDERLKNWLNPTVNVLYSFSATLGEGVGLVSLDLPSSPWHDLYSARHLSGILACQSNICWYRHPSFGELPDRILSISPIINFC